MTDERTTDRITGKRVLLDAVTLAKDAGVFIYDLGRAVIVKIKSVVANADKKKADGTDDKAKHD
ncbi:MAG: hypothetical protein K2F90_05465 [Clostridiales bacterium]|nr:hypothetical protein [Clostridiales bacterium]